MAPASGTEKVALIPVLALLVNTVLWSFIWIVMKQVTRYCGPFDFAALRNLAGALILFMVLMITRQSVRPPPLLPTVLIGLAQTTFYQGMEQWALVSSGAGHTVLLAYTMPFWVVPLAWLILSERPSANHWLGLILAATGLVFIIEPWHGMGSWHGTVQSLIGGFSWGLGMVLSKRMFRQYAPSPMLLTAWQMLFGGLAIAIIALCMPQRPIIWNSTLVLGMVYAVVFASCLGWWLWLYALQHLPTILVSFAGLCVPLASLLLAWVVLFEKPSLSEWIGTVLILGGLVAVSGVGEKNQYRRRENPV